MTGSLSELADRYASHAPKGEIVIVVGPPPEQAAASEEDLDAALNEALKRLSPSRAAAEVAIAPQCAEEARLRPRARTFS